jgi:uncharacterized protein
MSLVVDRVMPAPVSGATQPPSTRLAAWLLRHRALVLLSAALIALVSGYRTALTYAALRSDLEELLPETAPSVGAIAELRGRMPGLRHLGIVVDTGGAENVPAANRFVDELAARIRNRPGDLVGGVHTDVAAERQFAETYVLQLMDPVDVRKLREAVEQRRDWQVTRSMGMELLDDSEEPPPPIPVDELRKKYEQRHGKQRNVPGDRFVSEDGRSVVMLVQASSNATGRGDDAELLAGVQSEIESLGFPDAYAPGMSVGFAGDVATRVEEMEGLVADLGLSGAVVLLLVISALVMVFGSWRALPILGIPLMIGTLLTFALVALPPLSIRHLNSNTAFLGSIVVGNGINGGIILLARLWEERRRGAALERGIAVALGGSWRPTLAAALAASAAYGSLVFTDFRGFNQFGWIGAVGMLVCWATNMLLIPPLASLLARPAVGPEPLRRSLRSRFGELVLARPRAVLLVTSVLTVLAVIGLSRRADDWMEYDLSKLRRADSWQTGERYWGKRMDDTLGRYLTPTVVLARDAEQAHQIEQRVRETAERGDAGGLIASIRSIRSFILPEQQAALAEARRLRALLTPKLLAELTPADRELVQRAVSDRALQPLSADSLPNGLVAGLRERDGRTDRAVLIFPKLDAGTWDAGRISAYARDLRAAAEDGAEPAKVAGSLLLSSDIADSVRSDGPRATLFALLAVLAICAISFRSFGLSLAAVGSLFVGVTLMLGALAWTGQRLNFSNFVALPITFGIAADYSINMLKRYQSDARLRLSGALTATGSAVMLCSLTTIIGFGSLLVAQNRALFSFGLFAVTGEITCLLTAIVSLPAALVTMLRRSRPRANAPAPQPRLQREESGSA